MSSIHRISKSAHQSLEGIAQSGENCQNCARPEVRQVSKLILLSLSFIFFKFKIAEDIISDGEIEVPSTVPIHYHTALHLQRKRKLQRIGTKRRLL